MRWRPARNLALFALLSCATGAPSKPPDRPYGGSLISPSVYPGDFIDRQKIVALYGDRSLRFDAVLQKRGNELTLLGLTPFGSRAFVIRQTGTGVSFESFVPQTFPFPPRYILVDVHRVFFAWVLEHDAPPVDGMLEATREDEVVTEHWQGGRLLRRTFRRVDGNPQGQIVVDYDPGMARHGAPPSHVAFANGWYGYRLDIVTVSHQAL